MRILTIAACLLLLPCVAGAAETLPLGAPAQTKFATYDAATKKLYIARITGLNAARAVAIGPNDRGYVTSSHGANVADNRAFVSCLKGLLVVLDTNTGHVVTTLPIGPGGQSVIYDAQRKRIFSANADTTMSVIVVDGPDSYHALPPVATPQNARTATENFATGQIYLPVASTLMVVPADGSN